MHVCFPALILNPIPCCFATEYTISPHYQPHYHINSSFYCITNTKLRNLNQQNKQIESSVGIYTSISISLVLLFLSPVLDSEVQGLKLIYWDSNKVLFLGNQHYFYEIFCQKKGRLKSSHSYLIASENDT